MDQLRQSLSSVHSSRPFAPELAFNSAGRGVVGMLQFRHLPLPGIGRQFWWQRVGEFKWAHQEANNRNCTSCRQRREGT